MAYNFKTDYSYLFGSNSSSSSGFDLSQYASIKNGSYAKALKAYYAKEKTSSSSSSSSSSSTSTSSDSASTLQNVQNSTDKLKESADALLVKGSKSVFTKKDITTTDADGISTTKKDYDMDAIYKSVKSFVDDYNSVIDSTGKSSSNTILNQALNLINYTKSNKNVLAEIGITIGKDNKLTIDEEKFKATDGSRLQAIFGNTGGFGYQISAKASSINSSADKEVAKANTYTVNGVYSSANNTGSIINSLF